MRRLVLALCENLGLRFEDFVMAQQVLTAAQFDAFLAQVITAIQGLQANQGGPIGTDANTTSQISTIATTLGIADPTQPAPVAPNTTADAAPAAQ